MIHAGLILQFNQMNQFNLMNQKFRFKHQLKSVKPDESEVQYNHLIRSSVSQNLEEFLNRKVGEYNTADFIRTDPVSIPHLFSRQEDMEIAGFFAAIFAWGNRAMIINKSKDLLQRMGNTPYDFIRDTGTVRLKRLAGFKHRTFNETDLLYFVAFLHHHYTNHTSLETAFTQWMGPTDETVENGLNGFYRYFFSLPYAPERTKKHIASPAKNSTCKRLNMFLRWMVRNDNRGVDFGIWKKIAPAQLVCPVDVHVARVAARLHLLQRKPIGWKAALELTQNLKKFDPDDPVKYDFALFGLGVVEKY